MIMGDGVVESIILSIISYIYYIIPLYNKIINFTLILPWERLDMTVMVWLIKSINYILLLCYAPCSV